MSKAALLTLGTMGVFVLICWLSTTRWRLVNGHLVKKPLKRVDFNKPWKDQL